MLPDQVFGPLGDRLATRNPSIGCARLAGSGLSLSVFGFPVEGSVGSCSQTTVPHSLPLQLLRRTLVPPSDDNQVPSAKAASAACENNIRPNTAAQVRFIKAHLHPIGP